MTGFGKVDGAIEDAKTPRTNESQVTNFCANCKQQADEIDRLRAVVKGLLIEFVGPHEEGYSSVVNARAALKGQS